MQDSSMDNTQYEAPRPDDGQTSTSRPEGPPSNMPPASTPQQNPPRYDNQQASNAQANIPHQDSPNAPTPQNNPYYNPPQQVNRRPLGVTILSILMGIQGLLALLIGILAIVALAAIGRQFGVRGHTGIANTFDIIGWILGILPLVIGIIILAVAIGLFLLKTWAFWTTVIVTAIFLIRQIYEFFQPRDSYTLIIIGTIISAIVLLYLLLDRDVRRAFHIGGAGRERLV
jgi:hypothetical protein